MRSTARNAAAVVMLLAVLAPFVYALNGRAGIALQVVAGVGLVCLLFVRGASK